MTDKPRPRARAVDEGTEGTLWIMDGERAPTFDLLTPLVAEKRQRGPRPDRPIDEVEPIVSVLDSGCRSMAEAFRRNFERLLPQAPPA